MNNTKLNLEKITVSLFPKYIHGNPEKSKDKVLCVAVNEYGAILAEFEIEKDLLIRK